MSFVFKGLNIRILPFRLLPREQIVGRDFFSSPICINCEKETN